MPIASLLHLLNSYGGMGALFFFPIWMWHILPGHSYIANAYKLILWVTLTENVMSWPEKLQ
jgi:hypothetical protein